MKLLTCVCGVVFAFAMVCMAVGQDEDKAKKDLERLQGTWRVVAFETEGRKSTVEGTYTLTFKGNKVRQLHKIPKGADFHYSFKLDPTKNPKEIDMAVIKAGDEHDKGEVGKKVFGIYALDGDNLKLCVDPSVRPTTFNTKGKGRDTVQMILKRMEK